MYLTTYSFLLANTFSLKVLVSVSENFLSASGLIFCLILLFTTALVLPTTACSVAFFTFSLSPIGTASSYFFLLCQRLSLPSLGSCHWLQ